MSDHWSLALIVFLAIYFLTWLLIPYLLLQKKKPAATLAWLFAIILFPLAGPLIFLVLGPDRLRRKRLKKQRKLEVDGIHDKLESGLHGQHAASVLKKLDEKTTRFFHLLSKINELPVSSICGYQLLDDAHLYYQKLLHCIEQAKHHVHLQVYVWQEDRYGNMLLDALTAAAERGVKVRVLIDEIGSIGTSEHFFSPLVSAGGRFAWFSSLHMRKNRFFVNLRNHRKINIIDGEISFVGGMNIGREYAGEDPDLGSWFDMQIEFSGALSSVVQQCFAEDWYYAVEERIEGGQYFPEHQTTPQCAAQVVASGPDSDRDPMHKSFLALLSTAEKRVWITTGYFVPSEILLTGLQLCALRGVEVRLLVPTLLDHSLMVAVSRSFYDELLPHGVEIYETIDGIYHAKTMIVDSELSMVGSTNLDNRSMKLNFELNVVIHSPELNESLTKKLEKYYSKSRRVIFAEYHQRSFGQKLLEAAVRPFSPIL